MSAKKIKKSATIIDVAKKAGVSVGTVSNVINKTVTVSDITLKKVNDAIKQLKFKPNDIARSLRSTNTKLIGLLVPDITDFYMNIAKNFMKLAYENGYTVLLLDYDYYYKREISQLEMLLEKRVSGAIIMGGSHDDEYLKKLSKEGLKMLLLDRRISDSDISSIEFDNVSTIRRLIGELNKNGYKRIGFISETIAMTNLEDRYKGFLRGMTENRLKINEEHIYIYKELQLDKRRHGFEIMKELLDNQPLEKLPQVFIATSDFIAAGAMDAIREKGYSIPDDIAITGFDNSVISEYTTPTLTTVMQDSMAMGKLAWDIMQGMISESAPVKRQMLLSQEILFRNSCKIKK